jgi:predicted ATPase
MPNWIGKSETIHNVLKSTIDFDHLGVEIKPEFEINEIYNSYILTTQNRKYIRPDLHYAQLAHYNFPFDEAINKQEGVLFIKDDSTIQLSSGQRLFCFIVINVVGEIRLDSLIVIDEPELFLHPTLEIEFISLLKKVLTSFNSKAILATHSLSIARETPSKCVHVFRNLVDGLDVIHPPFETFGGDMQRISSYVFSDNVTNKPHDAWIRNKIEEYQDPKKINK